MLTFFQGLPGQQPVSGAPDFPRSAQKLPSTSEAESEASMSEASTEDLVPSLEAEVATDRDEEEAGKKKKKSKGLATMISVFTKGRKKKGQPSLSETEGESESSPRPPAQLPTGRRQPLPQAGRVWAGWGLIGVDAPLSRDRGGRARGREGPPVPAFTCCPLILGSEPVCPARAGTPRMIWGVLAPGR